MRPWPSGVFNVSYQKDSAIVRTKTQWTLFIAVAAVLLALPLILDGDEVLLHLLNYIGITIITVLGLNILMGFCGQISLGQSAFVGIGAYTTGILAARFSFPWYLTLVASLAAASVWGIIFGFPALRIKGFYLVMSTIASQMAFDFLVVHRPMSRYSGGINGLTVPDLNISGVDFDTQFKLFYLIMPLTVLAIFCAKNVARTKLGRSFQAVRDNDLAAQSMGVNLARTKLLAFLICALYAGLAGWLMAYFYRFVGATSFGLVPSIWFLSMLIVGGMGSTTGAIFGAVLWRLVEFVIGQSSTALSSVVPASSASGLFSVGPLFFAVLIVVTMVSDPRGLAHRWEVFKSWYRLWPFPY
ncbi:MAG TPA: branched-chain amino acid ABC transporter permease [Thermoleophilia bacterium]|nr:branched-chain amino acid ABC transporter permease [Thermoleophilia bacterium]